MIKEPTVFNLLCEKFDKIFLLTCAHRHDRHKQIFNQLLEIGYDKNQIEHVKKLQVIYTTTWKYNATIANAINGIHSRQCFTKANEYDCSRNHHNIIKQSLELGYEKILVIEDDIQFLNHNELYPIILNIPNEFGLLQMSGFTTEDINSKFGLLEKFNNGIFWLNTNNIHLWCTSMYAMGIEGMKYYINTMETMPCVADLPLYYYNKNDFYISTVPCAIQNHKYKSDIRTNEQDVALKHQNYYNNYPENNYYNF